jgi:microcystin-dependent protein
VADRFTIGAGADPVSASLHLHIVDTHMNPHPQYALGVDVTTEIAAAIATHAGLADPHTGYRLESVPIDDTMLATGMYLVPIGVPMIWLTGTPPTNHLLLDGSAVSRTTYDELFALWGVTFGVGNGTTTFNLPNFQRRVPAGYLAADADFGTLGATGGLADVTLTAAQSGVPAHGHTGTIAVSSSFTANYGSSGAVNPGSALGYTGGAPPPMFGVTDGTGYTNVTVASSGSTSINNNTAADASASHENLPPYITVNYIVRAA